MKRIAIVIGVILIAALAWWGYNNFIVQPATSEADATQAEQDATLAELEQVIWASGKLTPEQWAGLSPAASGSVSQIHVNEGDLVEAGDVLIELDNAVLKSQVEVAAAAVAEAEAALQQLKAGATKAELDGARADVAAAEAAVALAEAQLAEAEEAVSAANGDIGIARAQYNELASLPRTADVVAAQREVDLARAEVSRAQAAYEVVKGNPHIGTLPQAAELHQATISFEAAQELLKATKRGATRQELAVAQAQVDAARMKKQLTEAQIPASQANLLSAQAQLERAQAELKSLEEGATPEDIAVAEAKVQSAKASLASSQAQVDETQITAPFAGQVGTIHLRPGELASPGVAALMIGDTTDMRVETTDLRETDVTRLEVGMPVEVTFDAVPGERFDGSIVRIAPMSTVDKGSTNYTVVVVVDDLDPGLRWGMTAFVNIDAE